MKDQLRGCVKISAKGRQLYRFINMIHTGRICCFGQFCRQDVFYAEICRHDLPALKEMAEECGVELESSEVRTLSSSALKYRKRIGILIGLVLAIITVMYFSSVVVTIEIQGNYAVSDEDILAALDGLGIHEGASIRDIDLRYCANELRVRVEGISWAAIRHTGNRIVVEVTEVVPTPEIIPRNSACNIVSAKNAKITSVLVRDGFLMHKVGDYVHEGTLLVSGVSVSSSSGRTVLHHSMGKIIGEYQETVTFSGTFEPVQKIYTGRSDTRRSLRLFSMRIPLYIGRNKYSSYECSEQAEPLCIFGRELPVGIVRKKLRETELNSVKLSLNELDEELNRKIFFYEKNFIGEDTQIISRDIERTVTGEGMTYTVSYTLEGEIGVEKTLLAK